MLGRLDEQQGPGGADTIKGEEAAGEGGNYFKENPGAGQETVECPGSESVLLVGLISVLIF